MGKPSAAAVAVLDSEAARRSEDAHSAEEEYSDEDASGSNRSDDGKHGGGAIGDDGPTEEQVTMLFNALDADGSGTLERGEISMLAKELGQEMPEEALDAAMREMDDDGSGGIDLPEFKLWFVKQFGIAGGEDEETPLYDVRERIEKIYTTRLRPEHADRKIRDLGELMKGWAGREAALLRNVEQKYAVAPGSELTDESIKLTKKALAARADRLRRQQSASAPKEVSMRVANDRVKYRILSADDFERKKQHELEKQVNFFKTIMANRIQIEWRMSVKRQARHRIAATTAIAAAYRGWRVRARMLSHLAATFIQRQWRRYSTRRRAVLLELYEIAVRYIQRRVRWRQARHRARKALLAKHAVRACWERQQRRSKQIKALKREQAKARENTRKELFAKTMEEVLSYAAEQRAKEEAVRAAKEAELQKQREEHARQLIRKHVIRYILRRRLRAKVQIRRSHQVADMQALLFGSIGELLGAHPEEPTTSSAGDAETGSATPLSGPAVSTAAPEQGEVASGASAASGQWKRKSRRLKAMTTLRGLRAQAVTAELPIPATSQAETVATTAGVRGAAPEASKAQRPSGVASLLALPAEHSRRAKRMPKAGLSAVVRMHRSGALARRTTPDRLVPLT